jgi:hypothetical protein
MEVATTAWKHEITMIRASRINRDRYIGTKTLRSNRFKRSWTQGFQTVDSPASEVVAAKASTGSSLGSTIAWLSASCFGFGSSRL